MGLYLDLTLTQSSPNPILFWKYSTAVVIQITPLHWQARPLPGFLLKRTTQDLGVLKSVFLHKLRIYKYHLLQQITNFPMVLNTLLYLLWIEIQTYQRHLHTALTVFCSHRNYSVWFNSSQRHIECPSDDQLSHRFKDMPVMKCFNKVSFCCFFFFFAISNTYTLTLSHAHTHTHTHTQTNTHPCKLNSINKTYNVVRQCWPCICHDEQQIKKHTW